MTRQTTSMLAGRFIAPTAAGRSAVTVSAPRRTWPSPAGRMARCSVVLDVQPGSSKILSIGAAYPHTA